MRHIPIPRETDPHSPWDTSPFPVRMHIPGEAHLHSRWGTSLFLVRMCIPGKSHRHSRWGCLFHCDSSSLGMHILTGNGDVPHWECTSSPGMHILTGNAHTVKTRIRELPFFGVRLAKVLKLRSLTGYFAQTLGRGRGYVIKLNYGQKSLLVAVQSGKGYICFTKPYLLKWAVKDMLS